MLWESVDRLIDIAPSPADVWSHRLELLAARRLRATGRPVPAEFVAEERFAAIASMTAPVLLDRIAGLLDQPAIVLKGPAVAACYPEPTLRGFGDVDLLVEDAARAQGALLAAGFEPFGDPDDYRDLHHLRPLQARDLPLAVEIHSAPKWLPGLDAPPIRELFAGARIARGESILDPAPEHHTLMLVTHSWAHEPLRRLRDLVDIAAVAAQADRSELDRLARAWGIQRVWRTTIAAADALFFDGPEPRVLRLWARNLPLARERTVLENHVARLSSDFWALPLPIALGRVPHTLRIEMRPRGAEPWSAKLARSRLALHNLSRGRSHHDREWQSRLGNDVRGGGSLPPPQNDE